MNRLIIIGNGFDLAHNLDTKFSDFIKKYVAKSLDGFYSNSIHKDDLLEIRLNNGGTVQDNGVNIKADEAIGELLRLNKHHSCNVSMSEFLRVSIDRILDLKWVDLEIEYFNLLSNAKNTRLKGDRIKRIESINLQFSCMKRELNIFLKEIEAEIDLIVPSKDLVKCFCENINRDDIVFFDTKQDNKPEQLYFLNFNYTSTIDDYHKQCVDRIHSTVNNIHGRLDDQKNIPIFGFGDERDKRYMEFEEMNDNRLFEHIKSFEYLKTSNFYNLTRFIESNQFQVHIYGHSCGLSDRTLLSQIFEHNNCISIKIFYHKYEKGDDFTEKTYEISRHFSDKVTLRKKLAPYERSSPMPQAEKEISSN